MELVNALYAYKEHQPKQNSGLIYESISSLLRLLAPFVPHITEELWHDGINANESVHKQEWPTYEESALVVDEVEILLQINGKGKGKIVVPFGASKEELEKFAFANERIEKLIAGKKIIKVICVPDRLVNIVAK
jgi:leucyl-tRNA synthetase